MNSNSAQVTDDFSAFAAPDPKTAAENAKKLAATRKKEADLQKKLKPEQMKAANDLTDHMRSEDEAVLKGDLIQQLHDYMKLMREYHPERLEFLKIPKTFGIKNTVEELRIWIRDIQTELGKKGGLEFAKVIWVEGFKQIETLSVGTPAKFQGLGQWAELQVTSRQLKTGEIVCGPAIPTLAEFCCYHSNWFSTGVDVRMMLMVGNMLSEIHRHNSQKEEGAPAVPEAKPASKEAKNKVANL
jgi:hypothetical protein